MTAVPPGRGGAAPQLIIIPAPDLCNVAVSRTRLRAAGLAPIGVRRRPDGGETPAAWLARLAEGARR
jgi:hypothetical protein